MNGKTCFHNAELNSHGNFKQGKHLCSQVLKTQEEYEKKLVKNTRERKK